MKKFYLCISLTSIIIIGLFKPKDTFMPLFNIPFSSGSQEGVNNSQSKTPTTKSDQASSASKEEAQRIQKRELESLLGSARSAQPEIFADTAFQLIDGKVIKDKATQISLLEEVYNLAPSAKAKVKLVDTNDETDTRSFMANYGYSLNLDTLSIQSNAVKRLIPISRQKAKEYFDMIALPELKPTGCESPMVYDPSIYYDTFQELLTAFPEQTPAERQTNLGALVQAITNIETPLQVFSTIKLINSLKLSVIELNYLTHAITEQLKTETYNSRSFIYSTAVISEQIKKLALLCKSNNLSTDDLLDAYRSFLRRNLTATRCQDLFDGKPAETLAATQKHADAFNQILSDLKVSQDGKLFPLQANDLFPAEFDKAARINKYWEAPSAAAIRKGLSNLRSESPGNKKAELTTQEKVLWQDEFSNFYTKLKAWNNSFDGKAEMTTEDFFHQKCIIYFILLEKVSRSNPRYNEMLFDYVTFLAEGRNQQISLPEWLFQAKMILRWMEGMKLPFDHIEKAFEESPDELLRLIAKTRKYIAKYK